MDASIGYIFFRPPLLSEAIAFRYEQVRGQMYVKLFAILVAGRNVLLEGTIDLVVSDLVAEIPILAAYLLIFT